MPFSSLQQPTARDIYYGIMESSIDWGISLKTPLLELAERLAAQSNLHSMPNYRIYKLGLIAYCRCPSYILGKPKTMFFHIHPMGIAAVHCSSRHTHTKQQKKTPKVWFFQSMDLDIISLERHSLWDSLVPPAMLFYTIGQASFSKCFAGTDCLGTPRNQLWNGKKSVWFSRAFFQTWSTPQNCQV